MAYKVRIFEILDNPLYNTRNIGEVKPLALKNDPTFESYEDIRKFINDNTDIYVSRRFDKKGQAYGSEIISLEYNECGYIEPYEYVITYKLIAEEVV